MYAVRIVNLWTSRIRGGQCLDGVFDGVCADGVFAGVWGGGTVSGRSAFFAAVYCLYTRFPDFVQEKFSNICKMLEKSEADPAGAKRIRSILCHGGSTSGSGNVFGKLPESGFMVKRVYNGHN